MCGRFSSIYFNWESKFCSVLSAKWVHTERYGQHSIPDKWEIEFILLPIQSIYRMHGDINYHTTIHISKTAGNCMHSISTNVTNDGHKQAQTNGTGKKITNRIIIGMSVYLWILHIAHDQVWEIDCSTLFNRCVSEYCI